MILSQFISRGLSLIVLVCWLGVNDAIPFGPNPEGKVHPATLQPSNVQNLPKKIEPITDKPESLAGTTKLATDSSIKSVGKRRSSTNFNNNININVNGIYSTTIKPERKYTKFQMKKSKKNFLNDDKDVATGRPEESNSSNGNPKRTSAKPVEKQIKGSSMKRKEELPKKCGNEGSPNLSYTRSLPVNAPTIDVAGAFKVAGEADVKKTSSVHTDREITLCWIETMTIKEDPAYDPPKRLVIREFTISFEDAATIPDNYLECSKLDGEITPGDKETVCQSSLHEIIDKNTKRSQVTNFTSLTHVGPIVVHQQKTVRCATGDVVSKDIYELADGPDNLRKRVEIKVGPSIRDIGTASDQGPGECTFRSSPKESEENHSQPPVSACNSDESCEASNTCEDGEDCNGWNTTSACKDGDCATESLSGETESTSYRSDGAELSSTEVAKRTTTEKPDESLINRRHTTDQAGEDSCPEHDTACKLGRSTVGPVISTDSAEFCSGENCSESSDGSTGDIPSGENSDTSGPCSGENCSSNEESGTAETDGITMANDKSCQEGSGSCSCNGSSCLIRNSEESGTLKTENKLTDGTTILPIDDGNRKTLNDAECFSQSGECLGSSESSEKNEEITTTSSSGGNGTKIGASLGEDQKGTTPKDSSVELKTIQVVTDLPDAARSTKVLGLNEVPSVTETVRPCDGSKSEECVTMVPGGITLSDDVSGDTQTYSSSTEGKGLSAATTDDSESSGSSDDELSSSCEEGSDDEKCQLIESRSEDDEVTTDNSPQSIEMKGSTLPTPEDSTKDTDPVDDAVTLISSTVMYSETPMIETSGPTKPKNQTSDEDSSSGMDLVTACSMNPEDGSRNCIETTVTPSVNSTTNQTDRLSSILDETNLSSESCEFSASCRSKEILSSITETSQPTLVNSTEAVQNSEELSCDDGNESCETSSSGTSSETCEDSLSNGDCTNNTSTSEACDSSSNSCSSEANSSTGLTDEAITTATETAKELEHFSTTIDNVSTTVEARRSTSPTLSLTSAPTKGRHKLALRIKVLLEHINENKEKEKLVQVEKDLILNEKPEEHGNHSLIWQIKSLNNSMNMETFKSIFNCTALANFTEDFSKMREFKEKREERVGLQENLENNSIKVSTTEANDESRDGSIEGSDESASRRKREISILKGREREEKNITDLTKVEAIRESLLGVNEDFQKGVDHVLYRISQEFNDQASGVGNKPAESSPSKILKMLADPTDRRVQSRRRKRASKVEGVTVKELEHPVNGEEIGRWSNERFLSAADGGQVRSLLEFKILRDPGEDSRRIPSGF